MKEFQRTSLLLEVRQCEPAKKSVQGKPYEEQKILTQKPSESLIPQKASWLEGRIEEFVPTICRRYSEKQQRRIQRLKHPKTQRFYNQKQIKKNPSRESKRIYAVQEMREVI